MATTYFNWQGPQGRETVDEISRGDFPAGMDGQREFIKERRRLVSEYHMAGMAVYTSSRPCANWRD